MAHHDHSKENAERRKQGLPELHCPFGCNGMQSSSGQSGAAYCCHLIGFTVDESERIFEQLATTPWGNGDFFMANGRDKQRVQPTDIVINPLVKQVLTTGVHYAKKWVSGRVYRACTPAQAQAWRKRFAKDVDAALMAELAADDKASRIKALREELTALELDQQFVEENDGELEATPPIWGPPQQGEPGITDNLYSDDPRAEQTPALELAAPVGAR